MASELYIKRDDAIRAVLQNEGQAAVAAIQDLPFVDFGKMRDAIEHYKDAYKLAYKLYQEALDGQS